MSPYLTWYEFKKDLERQAGHVILNSEWLRVKPREPLPWNDTSMQSALSELARAKKRKHKRKSFAVANHGKR